MSRLGFSEYNFEATGYVPPPPPSLNGGRYTGEPFRPDAPWRNFPATPDVDYYNHTHIRSAMNLPPDAIYQYPGMVRPGNNWQSMPGVLPQNPQTTGLFLCTPPVCPDEKSEAPKAANYY